MEKSSTATLECEDIKTRLQNDDEDSIPLADDDVSASVLGTVFLLKKVVMGGKKRQNLSIWLQNSVGDSRRQKEVKEVKGRYMRQSGAMGHKKGHKKVKGGKGSQKEANTLSICI